MVFRQKQTARKSTAAPDRRFDWSQSKRAEDEQTISRLQAALRHSQKEVERLRYRLREICQRALETPDLYAISSPSSSCESPDSIKSGSSSPQVIIIREMGSWGMERKGRDAPDEQDWGEAADAAISLAESNKQEDGSQDSYDD